jgi:uncharacterized protein YbbC (DUF1343 family)
MTFFDRNAYRPVVTGLHILSILSRDYPNNFNYRTATSFDRRVGTAKLRMWLESGRPIDEIMEEWQNEADAFERKRKAYLLYA